MGNFEILSDSDYFIKCLNYLKSNWYFEKQAILKVNEIFLVVGKLHYHQGYQIHLLMQVQHISKLKKIQALNAPKDQMRPGNGIF